MKRTTIALAIALTFAASAAFARGATPVHPLTGSPSTSGAVGVGVGIGVGTGGDGGMGGIGNGGLGGMGGSVTNEAGDFRDLRIVPPAIAPSIMNSVICPMVMQGSKAGSVFFFSGSGTHQPDIVPLCVAWHLGQKDVVERMACQASAEYRAANRDCEAQ